MTLFYPDGRPARERKNRGRPMTPQRWPLMNVFRFEASPSSEASACFEHDQMGAKRGEIERSLDETAKTILSQNHCPKGNLHSTPHFLLWTHRANKTTPSFTRSNHSCAKQFVTTISHRYLSLHDIKRIKHKTNSGVFMRPIM